MAVIPLTDTQACQSYWKRCIENNLRYWRIFLAHHFTDVSLLDKEHETIIKAILFGLKLQPAWTDAYLLIVTLADFMERRGYWDTWHLVLRQAQATASELDDEAGYVTLSALSARLNHRQGKFARMVRNYRRTIRLARQTDDLFNEARACTNLGYFFIEQGYWHRAEVLCCHALKLFEQLDSNHGLAHTQNHLGILCMRRRQQVQAEYHLTQAYSIWQTMSDEHGMMRACNNLGALFNEMEQPDKALPWLEEATQKAHLVGEEVALGTILMNRGTSFRLTGKFVKAKTQLWQANTIFQQHSDNTGLALILDNSGLLEHAQGYWSEGNHYLVQAIGAWRRLQHTYNEIRAINYLIAGKLAAENYEDATSWLLEAERLLSKKELTDNYRLLYNKFQELRRSLISKQKKKTAAE